MGGAQFCHVLGTLRAAAPMLDQKRVPTLAAVAELAAQFQPAPAEPAAALPGGKQPSRTLAGKAGAGRGGHGSGAESSMLLGGQPLMPTMLMELVNRFHPNGGSLSAWEVGAALLWCMSHLSAVTNKLNGLPCHARVLDTGH